MAPLNVDLDQLVQRIDHDLPDADPVAKVGEARTQARALGDLGDQLIDHFVQRARAAGASWSQIGDAMGVSKQAAQQRAGAGSRYARFTDRARTVLAVAQDRARELDHDSIDTGHVLLGLLADTDALAAKVLVSLGASLDALVGAVRADLPAGTGTPGGHIPFTADCKRALDETAQSAVDLGHNYIGTEHILLGLLRVPGSAAARVLTAAGIDATRARDAVAAALVGYQHRTRRGG